MESGEQHTGVGLLEWRAEISVRIAHQELGPFLLPHDERVTLGRSDTCGLRSSHPSLSRTLAVFLPSSHGWIVENGSRTRLQARSPFALDASFSPRALVLLQPADWTLTWDLDVLVEASVRYRKAGPGVGLPTARDGGARLGVERAPQSRVRTGLAGDRLNLTPLQRQRLGALFAYEIDGLPKPDRLIPTGAQLCGASIPQMTGTVMKVMSYVNRHRDVPIEHIDDLGYHLVHVAGVLGPDDLPEPG